MIRALVTQRIDFWSDYNEYRDGIDRCWHAFFERLNWLPFYVPNKENYCRAYLEHIDPDVIVLTGGNSIEKDSISEARNAVERVLIDFGIEHDIPIVGVCHGMQIILHYFSQELVPLDGHVKQAHSIDYLGQSREVNSFHKLGVFHLDSTFSVLARASDDSIEAISHARYNIRAMLWHPERTQPFDVRDVDFFLNALQK